MLEQSHIADHWHRIEPVLREHFDGDHQRIRQACENGTAMLFTAQDGFVVLAVETNPDTGFDELLVWFAWGDGADMLERYQDALRTIARRFGCAAVVSRTAHDGLIRKLPVHGWTQRYVEFSLEA